MKQTMFTLPMPYHNYAMSDESGRRPAFSHIELSLVSVLHEACERVDWPDQLPGGAYEGSKYVWATYGVESNGHVCHMADYGTLRHAIDVLTGLGIVSGKQAEQVLEQAEPVNL